MWDIDFIKHLNFTKLIISISTYFLDLQGFKKPYEILRTVNVTANWELIYYLTACKFLRYL
jgi:hypothetical protein